MSDHPPSPPPRPYNGPPTLIPEFPEAPHYPDVPRKAEDEPLGFFEKPQVVKNLKRGFWVVLMLLIASDLLVHHHVHFGAEHIPGFYTAFSLIACVILFLMAKFAAAFVKRGEDYYD